MYFSLYGYIYVEFELAVFLHVWVPHFTNIGFSESNLDESLGYPMFSIFCAETDKQWRVNWWVVSTILKILVNGKDYHGLSSNILWKIKKCSKPPTSQLPSPFALSDTDLHRNPEQPEKRWDVGIDVGELPLWGVYKIEVPKMGYPVPPNHPKS